MTPSPFVGRAPPLAAIPLLLLIVVGYLSLATSFLIRSSTTTTTRISKPASIILGSSYYDQEPQEQQFSAQDLVWNLHENTPLPTHYDDDKIVSIFPGAISNKDLEIQVVTTLHERGFESENTLLATSLCVDETARRLEDDFVQVYGNNFNLGGLAGFPFAGTTGFENMCLHTPDNGSCLIVYGPHVGISTEGVVGEVERRGSTHLDTCCASAISALYHIQGTNGESDSTQMALVDLQQGAVQQLLSPHVDTLNSVHDPMVELPYILYNEQERLLWDIMEKQCDKLKTNVALLGGIQINTAPEAMDYFVPLRFQLVNNDLQVLDDMLGVLQDTWQQ